jgi:hypothetical protein
MSSTAAANANSPACAAPVGATTVREWFPKKKPDRPARHPAIAGETARMHMRYIPPKLGVVPKQPCQLLHSGSGVERQSELRPLEAVKNSSLQARAPAPPMPTRSPGKVGQALPPANPRRRQLLHRFLGSGCLRMKWASQDSHLAANAATHALTAAVTRGTLHLADGAAWSTAYV